MKNALFRYVETIRPELEDLSDRIFDHPEHGYEERQAADLLCRYLDTHGFTVEHGVGGLETAFRAEYAHGQSGPSIGLLCEYDAIEGFGHVCGHHMQGPAIVGAAVAIKEKMKGNPYRLVVYGTPAEETGGGKIDMLEHGCFQDIDVALMMHGSPTTTTDIKCMAMSSYTVTFHGTSAHAAIAPERGRSAFDALLLSFQAVEFLREHVLDDTRIHYTVTDAGGPENVVPCEATAVFALRSYDRQYLDTVIERFFKILDGAASMTQTTYTFETGRAFDSKIPVIALNDALMDNARAVNAPCIRPPREKTGSTDFGNVMYTLPGSCIRVAFVPEGTSSHSQEFFDAGKSRAAHDAVVFGAQILAGAAYDLVEDPSLLRAVQEEFAAKKGAACARV